MKKAFKTKALLRGVFAAFAISAVLVLTACVSNPLTGKRTMAFVSNSSLFPSTFAWYQEFLDESKVITGTPDAYMVERVGTRLAKAAQIWVASEGNPGYLDDYRWEFRLIEEDTINAWCAPGGKIVVYTGILPVTQTEEGLAVLLGHELSHALLNHGQQGSSADMLQQIGMLGVVLGSQAAGLSETTQTALLLAAYLGTTFGGTLPFSRNHESEADHYGLMLMSIAGYNPEAAVPFWERMTAFAGGGAPEFISTHPSNARRIRQLQEWTPGAKEKAAEFGVRF